MARYSKALTPAAEAAFLEALRGGALVGAAAALAGVAVSSLYCRRRRDSRFDSAWAQAAEAGLWAGEGPRRVRTGRRLRFSGARRGAFLDSLERSCDTKDSARRAGVWASTVYRNLKRDPRFARANSKALERGYRRLAGEAALERARSAARLRRALELGPPPTGRPPADFERMIRLLDQWWRPVPPPGAAPRRRVLSFDESLESLETRLSRLDLGPGFG